MAGGNYDEQQQPTILYAAEDHSTVTTTIRSMFEVDANSQEEGVQQHLLSATPSRGPSKQRNSRRRTRSLFVNFFQRSTSNTSTNNSDSELSPAPDYFGDDVHGEHVVLNDDHNDLNYQYLRADSRDRFTHYASPPTREPSISAPPFFVEASFPSPTDNTAPLPPLPTLHLPSVNSSAAFLLTESASVSSPSSVVGHQNSPQFSSPRRGSTDLELLPGGEVADASIPPPSLLRSSTDLLSESLDDPTLLRRRSGSLSSPPADSDGSDQATLVLSLKSERNAFRDKCLQLEAEIASIRNILSSSGGAGASSHQMITHHRKVIIQQSGVGGIPMVLPLGVNVTVLSEHRAGGAGRIYARSEDGETMENNSNKGGDPSGGDMAGSLLSSHNPESFGPSSSVRRNLSGLGGRRNSSSSIGGGHGDNRCQSRLTKDILRFVASIDSQIEATAQKRLNILSKVSKVVTALWPRALVKPYGSYVTNLSLPSSDMDYVIVLPAVQKNAMVETPGILEGRNSIKEVSHVTWSQFRHNLARLDSSFD